MSTRCGHGQIGLDWRRRTLGELPRHGDGVAGGGCRFWRVVEGWRAEGGARRLRLALEVEVRIACCPLALGGEAQGKGRKEGRRGRGRANRLTHAHLVGCG